MIFVKVSCACGRSWIAKFEIFQNAINYLLGEEQVLEE